MDGVSGPGVGSVYRVRHAGCVGMMMFVGKTKFGSGVGVLAVDVEQAETKERRKKKDRIVDDLINFICLVENVPKVSVKALFAYLNLRDGA